jgi:hypothetical protein
MLSDKYLWLVLELTPVHETYELASFQEPVTIKAKNKNIQNARNARVQRSQGEFCQPLWALALIPTAAFAYLKFKDKAIIPTDTPLQSAVEECESG